MRLAVFVALSGLTLLLSESTEAQEERGPQQRLAALRSSGTVAEGTLVSIEHLFETADRIESRYAEAAEAWRRRGRRYLDEAEAGRDPYPAAKGEIVNRGYRSPVSTVSQGYAVYVPPDYDPTRSYPLYVALHGGSSNGNLFLGVVLGNNMDWERYIEFLYDDFTPRWTPDWIVVAPTGFGQIMWRWMGERDVLDVIEDVQTHYSVDPDRVVLGGLSNGGVGAYAIGTRHAWRFSAVQAMAGAPSWMQYLGGTGRLNDTEETEVARISGLHLVENTENTDFRYYHGRSDTGPMRPRYIAEYTQEVQRLGLSARARWYDAGHDILYRVHRHGRVYGGLADIRRERSPREVHVVTGDYRAARQHWVSVTRIRDYPRLARVKAKVEEDAVSVETGNVDAFALDLRDMPGGEPLRVAVDGYVAFEGPRAHAGSRLHFLREGDRWTTGFPNRSGLQKRPGLSGPISDAYFGRMIHVYGTQNAEHRERLERAAERGARGWPLWSWDLKQEVFADTEVDDALMKEAHVVLYGSPGDNAVLQRIAGALPIRVEEDAVVMGEGEHAHRFEGRDVGTRFIYPNPLAPQRYVIVQAGVTPEVVDKANQLPEFLADFVVFEAGSLPRTQWRVQARHRALADGYFDGRWRIPGAGRQESGGAGDDQPPPSDDSPQEEPESSLPIPAAPPVPGPPRRYGAPASDPAGRAARRIWARVPTFENYRAEIPGAVWRTDRRAVWRIRPEQECLEELAASGLAARPRPQPTSIVPSPVELTGPVDGLWFRTTHEEEPVLISCEMALRLPLLVRILKRHGIHGAEMLSSYRSGPRTSFHTMGLAWDLSRFWTDRGWLSVLRHYEATPDQRTCEGSPPRNRRARTLRAIACELWQSRRFSTVLTPNYNEGHRDHFHIDARPDDPRLYVR